MDINAVYREVGTYRGAAEICGTTPKTVKRAVLAEAADVAGSVVVHNYDAVRDLVVDRVAKSQGRITAKRLLPIVAAAGYEGSARNFRRLVADVKAAWRVDHHRGRRPGVWAPGDVLAIDWGEIGPLHVEHPPVLRTPALRCYASGRSPLCHLLILRSFVGELSRPRWRSTSRVNACTGSRSWLGI